MSEEFDTYTIYELEARLHDVIHNKHQELNQVQLMQQAIHNFLQQNQMKVVKDLNVQKPNYATLFDCNS